MVTCLRKGFSFRCQLLGFITCMHFRTDQSIHPVNHPIISTRPCKSYPILNWMDSFPMETRPKSLSKSNIYFDLNFEVKAFLKYICWINPAAFIIKCLISSSCCMLSHQTIPRQHNTTQYTDSLCIFHFYVALF